MGNTIAVSKAVKICPEGEVVSLCPVPEDRTQTCEWHLQEETKECLDDECQLDCPINLLSFPIYMSNTPTRKQPEIPNT